MPTYLNRWAHYVVGLLLACSTASAEQPKGVVVSFGLNLPPLVRQARHLGGARWTGESVEQKEQQAPFNEELEAARNAYLEADFLRCLSIGRGVDRDAALTRGDWRAVGQLIMLTAACAHGADQPAAARSLIEQLVIQQLDKESTLRKRPDFEELFQKVREEVRSRAPVEVELTSSPPATVMVDGRRVCRRTPCTVSLPHGEHHFLLRRIGVGQRAIRRRVPPRKDKVELSVSLDLLDRATASTHLAVAKPWTRGFAAAAATTYDAQVVAVVWKKKDRVRAMVYDRSTNKIVGRGKAASANNALKAALLQWQPPGQPFYKRPVFYVPVIVATAVATGLAIYFATRSPERRAALVFE